MRLLRLGIILIILALSSLSALCQPDRYQAVISRVQALQHTSRTRVLQIGRSSQGRPLYAILITNPGNPSTITSERTRTLFICSQHGDESSSVAAMISLAEELSHTRNQQYCGILDKAVIAIVPVANPDGYSRFRRLNGRGADLNRDWSLGSQPETIAISRLVSTFKPQIIADEHEWLDGGPTRHTSIEVANYGVGAQYKLARLMSGAVTRDMAARGVSLGISHYQAKANPSLAHRHFAASGICSMLIETTPDLSPDARIRVYRSFAQGLLLTVTTSDDPRIVRNLRGLVSWHQSASPMFASLYAPKTTTVSWLPPLAALSLILFVILTAMGRGVKGHKEIAVPMANPRVRTIAVGVTDILDLNVSIRQKRAIMREYRLRPTDRQDMLRKPIPEAAILLDPSENLAVNRQWDSSMPRQAVPPTPSQDDRRLSRERIRARYLSDPV